MTSKNYFLAEIRNPLTLRCLAVVFFITLSASSCNNPMPDRFNCVESGQDPLTGQVFTKISGTNTSLDMIGIKNNSLLTGLVANTVNNVTFQIVDATSGNACNLLPALSTITTSISFPSGIARYPYSFTVPNIATKKAQCRIIQPDVGTSCSTDFFAIRPPSFTTVTTSSALGADSINGASVTNLPIIKAGDAFSLSVGLPYPSYNGTPVIDNTKVDAHAGKVQNGVISGTFSFAVPNAGNTLAIATGSNFTYSEVGYFRLLAGGIKDNAFTTVDQPNHCVVGSSSNIADASGKVGCDIGTATNTPYFGRFIPNGFKATPQTVTLGCNSGGFTYFGGEFSTQFDLEAVNASNVVTRNYHGAFAKFATNAIATDYARYGAQPANLTNPVSTVALTQGTQAPLINTAWNQGKATITLNHRIGRPASDTQPQSPVLNLLPTDGEATTASNTAITTATGATSIPMRYGRASVANAYGAETMPLTFDVFTQFYDNTGKWVTNTADNCTSLLPSAFTPTFPGGAGNNLTSAYQTNGWLTNVGNFAGGKGKFKLRAPGHGNNGWLLLSTPAVTELGGAKQMRASFGQYKSSLIYSREN